MIEDIKVDITQIDSSTGDKIGMFLTEFIIYGLIEKDCIIQLPSYIRTEWLDCALIDILDATKMKSLPLQDEYKLTCTIMSGNLNEYIPIEYLQNRPCTVEYNYERVSQETKRSIS